MCRISSKNLGPIRQHTLFEVLKTKNQKYWRIDVDYYRKPGRMNKIDNVGLLLFLEIGYKKHNIAFSSLAYCKLDFWRSVNIMTKTSCFSRMHDLQYRSRRRSFASNNIFIFKFFCGFTVAAWDGFESWKIVWFAMSGSFGLKRDTLNKYKIRMFLLFFVTIIIINLWIFKRKFGSAGEF